VITGKQVVAARGLLEISQSELAKRAGIGNSTLMRFEQGETDARTNIRDAIEKTLNDLGVDLVGEELCLARVWLKNFIVLMHTID
jgi:transcriptional regulator with XRE-family HTH domain